MRRRAHPTRLIACLAALTPLVFLLSGVRAAILPLSRVDWPSVLAIDPSLSIQTNCPPEPAGTPPAVCLKVPAGATVPGGFATSGDAVSGYAQTDAVLYGDLAGDGQTEAVIPVGVPLPAGTVGFLIYRAGNDGPQLVVAVSGNKLSLQMTDGALSVRRPWYAERDPNCCPSSFVTTGYILSGNALTAISESRQPIGGRLAPAAAPSATLPTGCGDATLTGAYGFAGGGLLLVDDNRQPVALLGILHFDGAGSGSGQVQLNHGAGADSISLDTVSYIVNADCTGSVSAAGGFRATFIILAGGQEIDLTGAGGLQFVSGLARPLAIACSDATLNGTYVLSTRGWLITQSSSGSSPQFVPATVNATQRFDAIGGSQRSAITATVAGQFSSIQMQSGTYSLDAGCSGSFDLVGSDGLEESGSIVAVGAGDEALVLGTTPNEVTLGTIRCTPGASCAGPGAQPGPTGSSSP